MIKTGENAARNTLKELFAQPYDCLILVHPFVEVLEQTSNEILKLTRSHLNINKELSASLMSVPVSERSRFLQRWLVDTLASFQFSPVMCTNPDLLFEPSLNIEPFSLFRQIARVKQVIIMWPGEYNKGILSYAIPEHKHYRTWKIDSALLQQPTVLIYPIST